MNKSFVFCALLSLSFAFNSNAKIMKVGSDVAIVPSDQPYMIYKFIDLDIELTFTRQNQYAAEVALTMEPLIANKYEQTFGYTLDSTLFVGIISDQNQIANAFSTQGPLNMQINYIGGSQSVDQFATNSWLKALLVHETAHNYQMNPKASKVSQSLHTFLGSGNISFGFLPIQVTPNSALTSFLLEGNAVLNESWHDNGGRLYNGRYLAESILQAQAGNITPEFLFNQDINTFPFYDRHYFVGGFFQLYLGEKYGLQKVNSFFYNHSKFWFWPYRTNYAFQMTFEQNFETEIAQYQQWLLDKGKNFVVASGKQVATSQAFSALSSDQDEIFYLISDAQNAPELVRLNKHSNKITKERKSYLNARLVKNNDEYYTQASNNLDPTFIAQGLFDENANIKEGSEGKVIQGYIDGTPVYFDVPSSFEKPQMYVGEKFYAQVNSSVTIDSQNNLYYFIQKGKQRTLYKNKTAIFTLNDYFGFVTDVDAKGRILFIANSKNGSSIYRLDTNKNNKVERLVTADNVVDAKIINENELLLATINQREYQYIISPINVTMQAPTTRTFFFEESSEATNTPPSELSSSKVLSADDNTTTASVNETKEHIDSEGVASTQSALDTESHNKPHKTNTVAQLSDNSTDYNQLTNLHYSATSLAVGSVVVDEESRFIYSVNTSFSDPLLTNSVSLFASQDENALGLVGGGYQNSAYYIPFSMTAYGVYNDGDESEYYFYDPITNTYASNSIDLVQSPRDYGAVISAQLPLLYSGYNYIDIEATYYQDADNNQRSPSIIALNLSHSEHYGKAVDYYFNHTLSAFVTEDRSDISEGARYRISHSMPWTSFIGMSLQGVKTDFERNTLNSETATRGVKLSPFSNGIVDDPAVITMPNVEHTRYIQQAFVAQIDIKKQFDFQALFFTFPFSLTQETLYAKQRYFAIDDYVGNNNKIKRINYNETTVGVTFDILVLNGYTIPISLEYVYNDNTHESSKFNMYLGGSF